MRMYLNLTENRCLLIESHIYRCVRLAVVQILPIWTDQNEHFMSALHAHLVQEQPVFRVLDHPL